MTFDRLLQESGNPGWRIKLATGALGALACSMALGQQVGNPATLAPAEEVAPIPRYKVELIVFEYNAGNAAGTELFAADIVPLEDELLSEFALQKHADAEQPETTQPLVFADNVAIEEEILLPPFSEEELLLNEISTYEQAGLKVLDPSEYVLNEIYDKLVELDAYTPLVRTAWIQKTIEEDLTTPIKLRRLGNSPLRLNGTVTLYLNRYLHLVVDLALDEKTAQANPYAQTDPADSAPYYGDNRSRSDDDVGYAQEYRSAPVHFRIEEDRIVRNGELRYYDHPKFGVLAKVTRVEEVRQEIGTTALSISSTARN